MGRWLLLSFGVLVLGAMVSFGQTRAADARSLGGRCDTTRDCRTGTHCIDDGAVAGQCSVECTAEDTCRQQFGADTICLGADLCARTCAAASDCPAHTRCNGYGWCESD